MSRPRKNLEASSSGPDPRVTIAIVVLLLVSLVLGIVACRAWRGGDAPSTGPVAPASDSPLEQLPAEPPLPGQLPGSVRAPEGTPGSVVIWPADLTWVTVAGVDLPVSPTEGPRRMPGGLAKDFSRTPTGAVLAAMHLVVRTSPQVGPAVFGLTLRDQVVGPDRVAFAQIVNEDYEAGRELLNLPYGEPLEPIRATIRGVRVDDFQPALVSVRLLFEAPDGTGRLGLASAIVQVSWSGTDWKLIAPPGGDWSRVRTPVDATAVAGYVPLPGR